MGPAREHIILANGAGGPAQPRDVLRLSYLEGDSGRNVRVGLPRFVRAVYHLPDRVLDLLEIASYVFAADRWIRRGEKDNVEYHSWSRILRFHVRVRDHCFWSNPKVQTCLSEALTFLMGDSEVSFLFEPGHSTPPTSLFDRAGFSIEGGGGPLNIMLFSGGLDSLCGAVDLLTESDASVILVSHKSRPGTTHTQRALVQAIQDRFPRRVSHYSFECTLSTTRAAEETQRSRSFLYTAIAYAVASAHGERCLSVYENGITSINLYRREDLMNARASRTTHPKTLRLLAAFFSMIDKEGFEIRHPYLFLTKAEVMSKLRSKTPELIASTVSCSKTFKLTGEASHCGYCSQCVDRRIAAFAAGAEELDHRGLYDHDIIADAIDDREAQTTVVDYIRQARLFCADSLDRFESNYFSELVDLVDYIPAEGSDSDKIAAIWALFQKHGLNVKHALDRIRSLHDNVYERIAPTSLLGMISAREYLRPEVHRLADSVVRVVRGALGDMFRRTKPKDEIDLNQKLSALLGSHQDKLRSEHPTVSFACACTIPDLLVLGTDLLIEGKYIRQGTPPSKANEGIAADLTKYPPASFILFVVYDPLHKIASDAVFVSDIQSRGRNRLIIVR